MRDLQGNFRAEKVEAFMQKLRADHLLRVLSAQALVERRRGGPTYPAKDLQKVPNRTGA